jgi:hypothetical protein
MFQSKRKTRKPLVSAAWPHLRIACYSANNERRAFGIHDTHIFAVDAIIERRVAGSGVFSLVQTTVSKG